MLSGIILSAGESSRMQGLVKALLELKGKSFIENIIDKMRGLPLGELIVVLGANRGEILEKVKVYDVRVVVNDNWKEGQISSLRIGIQNLSSASEGVMFTLADHPTVTFSTYKKLFDVWMGDKSSIVLPSYNMRKGHPTILPGFLYGQILGRELSGGARDLFKENRDIIRYVTVDDPGVVKDVDTIEDYNNLKTGRGY
jgi:molybdenum cofactor cytidylyltransferase